MLRLIRIAAVLARPQPDRLCYCQCFLSFPVSYVFVHKSFFFDVLVRGYSFRRMESMDTRELRKRASGTAEGGAERPRRPLPQGWKPETDPYTQPPAGLQVRGRCQATPRLRLLYVYYIAARRSSLCGHAHAAGCVAPWSDDTCSVRFPPRTRLKSRRMTKTKRCYLRTSCLTTALRAVSRAR